MGTVVFEHRSVLADEVLSLLRPARGEVFVDGTLGGGGHAWLILTATAPDGRLIGLDRDEAALAAARCHLEEFGSRALLRQASYAEVAEVLDAVGIAEIDGMLLDLGVSSHQLDTPERGFSFRVDGPLDMRMNPKEGETAADVVNSREERELARIFREYGEERWAGRIARRIVRQRALAPLTSTRQLAELVRETVPGGMAPARIHPATRVFQALRIEVNRELEQLERGISQGFDRLRPGGRLAVISFHSLEDRIVKRFFQDLTRGCICPPQLPVCGCGRKPRAQLLARKGVRAAESEIAINPRARSAVLRGVVRLD